MKYFPLLLSIFLVCCVNNEFLQPEALEADVAQDIIIVTRDSLTIRLYKGDYEVVQTETGKALRGKGDLFLNKEQTKIKQIDVDISLSRIMSINRFEVTPLHHFGAFICVSAFVFVMTVLLLLRGHSVAG